MLDGWLTTLTNLEGIDFNGVKITQDIITDKKALVDKIKSIDNAQILLLKAYLTAKWYSDYYTQPINDPATLNRTQIL